MGAVGALSAFGMAQGMTPPPSNVAGYLGAAFGGGLVSLLTPCVFPMIPVTVSYFTKRHEGGAVAGAASYATGIISTFAIIGIGASLLFGATGISRFATNPWVNIVLALFFVVLALNLFGLYEIQLPSGLTSKLSQGSRKQGLAGPFFMGATFSLTSFTCTAPIVATLLSQAATGSSVVMPALGMAAYGTAFAIPFFFLALFPAAMNKVPKSGGWLAAVKPVLGFIELAAAMKFLSNADLTLQWGLITRPVFVASWILIFGLLAGYLLGLPDRLKEVGTGRRVFGAATLVLVVYLFGGLNKGSLGELNAYLPPDPYPLNGKQTQVATEKGEKAGPVIYTSLEEAKKVAAAENKPIFIDFTGVNCVNCRWMEENIFPKQEVKPVLEKFIRVQLYTDRPTAEDKANQDLQTKLAKNNALPTYVLMKPDGTTIVDKFEGATRKVEEFAQFLGKA